MENRFLNQEKVNFNAENTERKNRVDRYKKGNDNINVGNLWLYIFLVAIVVLSHYIFSEYFFIPQEIAPK